jgi:hypothetical protein
MFLDRHQHANGDLQGLFLDDICKTPLISARPVPATAGLQGPTAILQPFQF